MKSKVRLRIQKAQETRKSLKLRLSQTKKDFGLANEALDAATALYEVEQRELQKLGESVKDSLTRAKGYRAVGMFANVIAERVR